MIIIYYKFHYVIRVLEGKEDKTLDSISYSVAHTLLCFSIKDRYAGTWTIVFWNKGNRISSGLTFQREEIMRKVFICSFIPHVYFVHSTEIIQISLESNQIRNRNRFTLQCWRISSRIEALKKVVSAVRTCASFGGNWSIPNSLIQSQRNDFLQSIKPVWNGCEDQELDGSK